MRSFLVPRVCNEFFILSCSQGRLFAYSDTHRHRLGPNFLQLPVNCPYRVTVANQQRDGPQCYHNQAGAPNYYPNSFSGPAPAPSVKAATYEVSGVVDRLF